VPILDMGFVDALKAGRIEIVSAVEALDGDEVVLADGSRIAPDAVVAATGYARALEPLVGHFGVLDERGRPTVHGPASPPDAPGLHFIGFSDPISGMFREINHDAWRIGDAIVHDRLDAPSSTARRPGPRGDRLLAQARLRLRGLRAA
jgi:putative flavoprotein involved in K+ transport